MHTMCATCAHVCHTCDPHNNATNRIHIWTQLASGSPLASLREPLYVTQKHDFLFIHEQNVPSVRAAFYSTDHCELDTLERLYATFYNGE